MGRGEQVWCQHAVDSNAMLRGQFTGLPWHLRPGMALEGPYTQPRERTIGQRAAREAVRRDACRQHCSRERGSGRGWNTHAMRASLGTFHRALLVAMRAGPQHAVWPIHTPHPAPATHGRAPE